MGRSSGSDRQYDLSCYVPAAAENQCLLNLLKWKDRLKDGAKLAVFD